MIQFIEIPVTEIDLIQPLWEKLREHQALKSTYFASDLRKVTWEERKTKLITPDKRLRLLLAKDDEYVGYCIFSITDETKGEIDSIFIDNDYRKSGIGSEFMQQALNWFDTAGVTDIKISVVAGNEEVLDFYKKFGFKPRGINLKRT